MTQINAVKMSFYIWLRPPLNEADHAGARHAVSWLSGTVLTLVFTLPTLAMAYSQRGRRLTIVFWRPIVYTATLYATAEKKTIYYVDEITKKRNRQQATQI